MKFNPITNKLYTNDGFFIKELYCPYNMKIKDLNISKSGNNTCKLCEKNILNTDKLSDEVIIDLIEKDSNACINIDLNQENLEIITNGEFKR